MFGMKAIALTDTNGLCGAISFYKLAINNGIKPIIGVEIDDPSYPCVKAILLAKNKKGYSEICKIVTERNLKNDFSLKEQLENIKNVIIISHSPELLKHLAGAWRDNILYAELTCHSDPKSRMKCQKLIEFVKKLNIPLVATNNVHFFDRREYYIYKILKAIKENTTISNLEQEKLASENCYLKSPQEMKILFSEIPEAIINTNCIAEECNLKLGFGKYIFPEYDPPSNETSSSYLRKICVEGLRKRYKTLNSKALNRLDYELRVIESLGFSDYFLVVWDIVKKAKELRIPYIGRGSVANSLVAYCLQITNVDPLKYDLYFERFLNPERKNPPDIDLDFSWNERDVIINYIFRKYGEKRVALISTLNRFAARSAIREVGKAMGLSDSEIGEFTSKIPHIRANEVKCLKKYAECKNLSINKSPYRIILSIAQRIADFPYHFSIHCGGIVIAPEPITEYTPLQKANKGVIITQYDMFDIEELGLVKIDILGNRSLGVLKDTLKRIEENYGKLPDIYNFQKIFKDEKVRELIKNGRTMGCFYIESPAMRSLLRKLKVDNFEMLTIASSIIRPGVAESGMMDEFIKRHLNPSEIRYLHPKLKDLLGETYGIMVYQEDVIKVAHYLAGMSLGEADLLRRAMSGKMRSEQAMAQLEDKFISSCIKRKINKNIAREIWRQIKSFAGYAFCKAHSASFAQLSFQVAYLKAYYPAEFMASVISNQGGFYDTYAYIQEAKRMGLKILLPDVNRSNYEYIGKGREIRIGLGQIKGLTLQTINSILKERKRGIFKSLSDLIRRTQAGYQELRNLIRVGACDCFGYSRPKLLWILDIEWKKLKNKNLDMLFSDENIKNIIYPLPKLLEYSPPEKCKIETELLGFPLTLHPLELIEDKIKEIKPISAQKMENYVDKNVKMIGWLIAMKRIVSRKSNHPMKFMSLEDTSGTYEATLFPHVYEKFGYLTFSRGPYLIEGKIKKHFGVCSLIAEKISLLK
jgi:DNA-directed DNA polymerase III PolC